MSRRKFTAEFKTKIVLEVLREEKELGEIAKEHEINPNQIRNWKKTFLENATMIFNESEKSKTLHRLEEKCKEKESSMLKTIGQLTMERDYLQEQVKKKDLQVYLRRK